MQTDALSLGRVSTVVSKYQSAEFNPRRARELSEVYKRDECPPRRRKGGRTPKADRATPRDQTKSSLTRPPHKVSILTICSRNAEALARRASAFSRAASYCGKSFSIAAMFDACLPCCSAKLSSRLSRRRVCESVTAMWFLFPRHPALLLEIEKVVCVSRDVARDALQFCYLHRLQAGDGDR